MNIGGMSTQGGDCFGTFMQSGLPRQTLKDVWQTVAGDMPHLDRQQFVSCLYLMDLAKQGRPVPPSLPPGPFPPGPGSWNQPPSPAASTRFDLGSVQQVHPPPPLPSLLSPSCRPCTYLCMLHAKQTLHSLQASKLAVDPLACISRN
jgi:hypothetical protein